MNTGKLPTSCRQGVITLLPKIGDNGLLKKRRPITLLSCDLNVYTKCLSPRLKRVLLDIIHADQTCGIPGRDTSMTVLLYHVILLIMLNVMVFLCQLSI